MAALHQAPGCAPPSISLQGMRGGGQQGWKGRMGETSMREGPEEDDHVRSTQLPSPTRTHYPPSSTICFCSLDPPVSPSSTSDTALPWGPRQPTQSRRHIHGHDQRLWLACSTHALQLLHPGRFIVYGLQRRGSIGCRCDFQD